MTKRKRKKKKPLTTPDKIALAMLILELIKWLVELLKKQTLGGVAPLFTLIIIHTYRSVKWKTKTLIKTIKK